MSIAFNPFTGEFETRVDVSDFAQKSLNLSDLADVPTARINLGLVAGGAGDIWVEKAGDIMTDLLLINQAGNETSGSDRGVRVNGFAAQSGAFYKFGISSNGRARINSSGTVELRVNNVLVNDIAQSATNYRNSFRAYANFQWGSGANYTSRYRPTPDKVNFAYGNNADINVIMRFNNANALEVVGNIGLNGVAPVGMAAAYVQTYAITTRTLNVVNTAVLTDNTGGTADTTVAAVAGSGADATINDNFADLIAQINQLRSEQVNLKQFANSLTDDSQALGVAA
jgi:hypothetical protein